MFKISRTTKTEELKKALSANYKALKVADKSLADRIMYASKHEDKATRKDLVDLVKEAVTVLGDKFVVPALAEEKTPEKEVQTPAKKTTKDTTPKVENSLKTKAKKSSKTTPAKDAEAPVKEAKTPAKEVAKKSTTKKEESKTKAEKTPAKKSAKKTDGVTVLEDTDKTVQLAKEFPETIEVDGETYKVDHTIKKMEDLADGEFEFAFYWNKRHLKQFDYFSRVLGQPKSFPNDLDTCQLVYLSDEGKVAYCVSDATEALYVVLANDLVEEDGLRIASLSCIEFQIYRKVDAE